MEQQTTLIALTLTAAGLGIFHTLIGPDHYLPFVALSRNKNWSISKTLLITFGCGLAHTLSSVLIGCVGIFIGYSAGVLEEIEGGRADIVKWLLLGFAVAYILYGMKRAMSWKVGSVHQHEDGVIHSHGSFVSHTHNAPITSDASFWAIFVIFALGPCEILIPLVVEPAARGDWVGVWSISFVFSTATILTMLTLVCSLVFGIKKINLPTSFFSRWSAVITGVVILGCALFMFAGF